MRHSDINQRPPKVLILVSLTLSLVLLSSCGFQLRGLDVSLLESVSVSSPPEIAATRRALQKELAVHDVAIVPRAPGVVHLAINDERSIRRPVSTTASIDAAQYELRLEADISASKDDAVLIPTATLVSERIYSVDSLNLSGSHEEQTILLSEMRTELAQHMIRRLEAVAIDKGGP